MSDKSVRFEGSSDVPSSKVVASLLAAATRVKDVYTEVLQGFEITYEQHAVLALVSESGEDGITSTLVAKRLSRSKPAVSRLVITLEQKSLLVRRCQRTDRRVMTCHITYQGEALLSAVLPLLEETYARVFCPLDESSLKQLVDYLSELG